MRFHNIVGKAVLDSSGNITGKVSNMEIDLVTGTIKQIFIKRGLLSTFSIKPDKIITMGDVIIIRTPCKKEDTEKIETFDRLGIKRMVLCSC